MKKILIIFLAFFVFLIVGDVKAAEVKTGTYRIVSALDNKKMLTEKNGNIVLGSKNSSKNTTWDVYSDGKTYRLKSHNNNNYSIGLKGRYLFNKKNIRYYKTNNNRTQKWKLNYANNNYYYITSVYGNYNIDVYAKKKSNGTNIQLYKGNGSKAQKWKFIRIDENKKPLSEGTYIIKSKLNNSNVIDLQGRKTSNKANIQLYSDNLTWGQVWNLKYSKGRYTFTSYLDNTRAIDIQANKYKAKANIQLYKKNDTNAQRYIINSNKDNTYSISSYDGLWTFDVKSASTKPGANLWLFSPNGTSAQKFIFKKVNISPISNGYYVINSMLTSNKVVGISDESVYNGKNVDLRTNENNDNTKWYIKKIKDDIYNIAISENINYYLGLNGNNVVLSTSKDDNAQKWSIRKNDDGTYSIVNLKNKKSLDIDGTNARVYNSSGTSAQKFKFTKTTPSRFIKTYDNGRYVIKSAINNSLVMDVHGAKKENGANVQLYTSNSTKAQNWKLEYIGDGAYRIRSYINPNLVLTASGNNVVSSKYTNTDYQKWYFDKNNDKTAIISMGNGKYLNIDSTNPVNSTNISLSNNKSSTSEFVLSKTSYVIKYKGVDLSEFNNITSWSSLASEIDFAVIRAGYAEELIQNGKDKYQDAKYIENVKMCEQYNIPYALYFYSYANKVKSSDKPSYNTTNIDSSESEASHMINLFKKTKNSGYNPTLSTKVFYDQEETDYIYNKVKNYYGETNSNNPKTRKMLTNIINDFCNRMNNSGYKCGLYASRSWLTDKINVVDVANKNSIWIAEWPGYNTFSKGLSGSPNYTKTKYKIWQFSDAGNVSGISGKVDLDIGYDIFE